MPWSELLTDLATRVFKNYGPVAEVRLTVAPFPSSTRPHVGELSVLASRAATSTSFTQDVSLLRYGLDHQGPNVIDLVVTAHYGDGPQVSEVPEGETIRSQLIELLEGYPTESDYWETLIKALGMALLDRHAAFDSIELRLTVYPTATLTYPHEVFARLERASEEETGLDEPSPAAENRPEVIRLDEQPWYEAEDRAVARELISPRNSSTEALSIAEILVPPGVTVRPHHHHMEEVYHVLAGEGVVMVEDQKQRVSAGDTVLIPPHAWHNIVNTSESELRLHVTCVPAWAPEHLIFERRSVASHRAVLAP